MHNYYAHIAVDRFGLGVSAQDLNTAQNNPKKWVRSQIKTPRNISFGQSSQTLLTEFYENRQIDDKDKKRATAKARRHKLINTHQKRIEHMATTSAPFVERLVLFWSNHFTVSGEKGAIASALPAYENEAIRPHVFGKFEDMLLAVTQHPCMLIYLDNTLSIGPNSPQGQRRDKDLNENLAREILELHTLGAQGGYTQEDIISLAKILTGWSTQKRARKNGRMNGNIGGFNFIRAQHEPGGKILLGQTYSEDGVKEGRKALRDLARHPSTAKHIARKLVRHFVSDDPPEAAITQIAKIFRETQGNLAKVSAALIELDEVWDAPHRKVKSPYEFVIAALRASRTEMNELPVLRGNMMLTSLKTFGQMPLHAPSPAGWPDIASAWVAPEALMHRIEWARQFARFVPQSIKVEALYSAIIEPFETPDIAKMIKGAPSREDAIALIFASSQFQRR